MIIRYPSFYKSFHCTASACPDTCCAGWNIHIDRKSLENYQSQKGPFGRKLRKEINAKTSCFKMESRRCRMLTEEGLCTIQQNLGEASLCQTCRIYPRHMEAYPGFREYMLMLSCPEAARMMLTRKEPMIFREKHVQEWEKTPRGHLQEKHLKEKESQKCWQLSEVPEIQETLEDAAREEGELLEALCRVRKTVEAFLTDRAELPEQRISMVLALCHDVQNQIGKYETEKIEEVCEKFEKGIKRLKKQITEDMAGNQMGNMQQETRKELRTGYLQLLDAWEPVTDTWPDFYEEYLEKLEQTEEKTYQQERKAFEKQWRENFQEAAEQLLMCFQFTYLLGACYDRNLWGKAVLTAYSYLIIKELCFGIYLDGGTCQMTDLIETTHLYSRACEHSDRNLEILEELFKDRTLFSMERLLYALGED